MSSVRRTYTREFKVEAAKLSYNSDKPVEEIAESLGVSQSSLNRWRREYREDPDQAFPGSGQQKERDAEVARLQKELRQAQMENEILKKAAAIPSTSLRTGFTRNLR
jgi:transposase